MSDRSTAARPATHPASCGEVRLDTSLELLLDHIPAAADRRVLATVVATAGSTYRKPGARMMIMADGSYLGLLSGGCLEADLLFHAREVLESGRARAVAYDMRGPDDVLFGIGAGCEGAMRVLLEPAGPGSTAETSLIAAGRATRAGEPTALALVHESDELELGTYHSGAEPPALRAPVHEALESRQSRSVWDEQRRARAFIQYLAPPPHLLICGAGPDAEPVAAAARTLGWRVTVVDHRPAYSVDNRFPGARVLLADAKSLRDSVELQGCHAAVVMSHHLASDQVYLRELANAGVPPYVGLLGPEARRQRIAADLGPVADKLRGRLRGPVGLDIGAATPEGIALAIVTEVHAWLAGRPV
jgi:xanthine/CO dehydrogenase XdhC/CoxF family maturation factor